MFKHKDTRKWVCSLLWKYYNMYRTMGNDIETASDLAIEQLQRTIRRYGYGDDTIARVSDIPSR